MEQEVKKTSKSSKKSYFPMERLAKENRLQKKDTPKVKEEKKETKVEKKTTKETVKSTAKVLPKKPKKVTKPKEVIVDTHEKERLAKERKEKRALKLTAIDPQIAPTNRLTTATLIPNINENHAPEERQVKMSLPSSVVPKMKLGLSIPSFNT